MNAKKWSTINRYRNLKIVQLEHETTDEELFNEFKECFFEDWREIMANLIADVDADILSESSIETIEEELEILKSNLS